VFQQSLVGSGRATRKSWSFAVSLLAQTLVICLVLLATIAYTPLLPAARFAAVILEPPKPPAGPQSVPEQTPVVQPERYTGELTQPTRIPDRARIVDPAEAPRISGVPYPGVVGAMPGIPHGVIDSIGSRVPPPKPPEPAVKAPEPPATGPVHVSSSLQAARLIRRVEPIYPQLARQARISGQVRLRAMISADGAVDQLTVLSGHPLLIRAAVDAVSQWRYRPTMLSGRATPVATEIEVNFVLR
jgi:protein TonB